MKSNVVLIGMPGCGKSTCGVLAAKGLQKSFVDTDLLIQAREQMALQEIINRKGNEYFSTLEEDVLATLEEQNAIVATGGSAVYYERAMKHLKEDGIIVYLKVSFEEMMHRIHNIKSRGILLKKGETMEQMFEMRTSLYEKYADIIIDCDGNDTEESVSMICEAVRHQKA